MSVRKALAAIVLVVSACSPSTTDTPQISRVAAPTTLAPIATTNAECAVVANRLADMADEASNNMVLSSEVSLGVAAGEISFSSAVAVLYAISEDQYDLADRISRLEVPDCGCGMDTSAELFAEGIELSAGANAFTAMGLEALDPDMLDLATLTLDEGTSAIQQATAIVLRCDP